MSFKRAGDDHCALRLQKKQRVAGLFAEDIPADEVNRTRSGKYVCLVCPHNPVLDTMPMLSIHRQGKNHLTNTSIKMERDHNLSDMLQKRRQELYLQEADIDIGPSRGGQNTMDAFNEESETAPLLAKARLLTKTVAAQSANKSQGQKFTSKNKKLGEKRTLESQQYINSKPGKMFKKSKPFFQSRVELKLGDIVNKNTERTTFARKETPCKTDPNFDKLSKPSDGFNSVVQRSKSLAPIEGTRNENKVNNLSTVVPPETKGYCRDDLSNICELVGASDKTLEWQVVGSNSADEERPISDKIDLEKQKRYLDMKMSGWILDSNGKWIKDENVEFDSDDEEPT